MVKLVTFALLTGILMGIVLGNLTGKLTVDGIITGVLPIVFLAVASFVVYRRESVKRFEATE